MKKQFFSIELIIFAFHILFSQHTLAMDLLNMDNTLSISMTTGIITNPMATAVIRTITTAIAIGAFVYKKLHMRLAKKAHDLNISDQHTNTPIKMANLAPPEDPENDDPENDFFQKLKKRSDRKVRSKRFGNLYHDPITDLWWSKDRAGHGGLHYKVFKKTANSFDWQYDANVHGLAILAKHKGPTGLSIPFKEVIF